MKRKIITLFISIIAIMSCITLTSADNTTNELMMMENSPYAEEENRLGNIENSPKNESDRIGENVKTTNKEEAISEIIKIYQKENVVLQELLEGVSLPDLSIMDVVEVYAALSFQIDGDDIVRLL